MISRVLTPASGLDVTAEPSVDREYWLTDYRCENRATVIIERAGEPSSELLTTSSVERALRTKTHGFRGNADQSDDRHPRSPLGNPASVDQTNVT